MGSIVRSFFPAHRLAFSGRLLREVSEAHAQEIERKVSVLAARAKEGQGLQELMLPGVIELALCSEDEGSLLALWCEQRGLAPGQFSAPGTNVNNLKRLQRRIGEEAKQLPANHPNLLVIHSMEAIRVSDNPEHLIPSLEEAIFDKPNICMFVLTGTELGGGPEESRSLGPHVFRRRTLYGLRETSYVLLNRFCRAKIAPATLTKMLTAFSA